MKRHISAGANTGARIWLVLLMVGGMLLGMVQGASARTTGATLPPTKQPTSSRFDISGFIKASDNKGTSFNVGLGGSGSTSGQNYQEDLALTFDPSELGGGGAGLGSGPVTITSSVILLDGKLYTRTTGLGDLGGGSLSGGDETKWLEEDAGPGSANGSLFGGSMTSIDPRYASAYTVTQVGQETIDGAATTKYRVDVDFKKVAALAGGSADSLGDVKYMMFLWVGNSDQYVHRLSISLTSASTTEGTTTNVDLELTLNLHDFDTPVTITAPTNVERVDTSGMNSAGGLGGLLGGLPGGMSTGVEMGMPTTGGPMGTGGGAGMPKTGVHTAADQSGNLAWLALGLLFLSSGVAVRRLALKSYK